MADSMDPTDDLSANGNPDDEMEVGTLDDEPDVDALAAQNQKLQDDMKNLDGRYRNMQGLSQKTKNENEKIKSALEQHGLELAADGNLVKKQYDVGKDDKPLTETEFLEGISKNPRETIDKTVEAKVKAALQAKEAAEAKANLRQLQNDDRARIKSLDGVTPEVEARLMDIIDKKNLIWANEPFSAAIPYLRDRNLQEQLMETLDIGAPNKTGQKMAAAVARNGKPNSQAPSETGDDESDRKSYMNLSDKELEKQVRKQSIEVTGRPIVGR